NAAIVLGLSQAETQLPAIPMQVGWILIRRTLLLLIIATGLASCTHHAPPEDVDKAAAQFFLRLKSAEYGTIYDDATPKYKDAKSQAEAQGDLEKLAGLGRPEKWVRTSLAFNDKDKSHLALPTYILTTDQMSVTVTLTFEDDDGEWKFMAFSAMPHASHPT
ncbi:MAG TPA: hypothetical protein VI756_17455, partial [Blastocatellia bacterium]